MFLRQLRTSITSSPLARQLSDRTTFKPAVRAAARLKEKLGPQPSPLRSPTFPTSKEGGRDALVKGYGGERTAGGGGGAPSARFGGSGGNKKPGASGGGAGGSARKPMRDTEGSSQDMVQETTLSESTSLMTRVVHIGRVSRMTGQGRKTQFRALVIMGNGKGAAGFGVGKGLNPKSALSSAIREGEKDLVIVDISPWGSLYHDVQGYCNNTKVIIRAVPSHKWYSTAGNMMRAIMECTGISLFSCKILGRRNPFSVVNAAFDALGHHKTPKEIARKRGRRLVDVANPALFKSEDVH